MSDPIPDISQFAGAKTLPDTVVPLLEDYEILGELPRGGQAVVYRAIHKATKMKVALKVLHPSLHASESARHHFEREVALVASLNHPNIIKIHDSGILRKQYYFSMEYIQGRPLDDYIREHALGRKEITSLFIKICAAMTHAHQRGVIHRDLKPSNILVDQREEPKIVDFGLAKTEDPLGWGSGAEATLTVTGEIKGTLSYMSPEQAEGRSEGVDVRTDVYALGVILYRLLIGDFPYPVDQSVVKVLQTIQTAEPIRPKQVLKGFDRDLEAILLKCLEKTPADRYQSAAELTDDLRRWRDRRPVMARSVSSLYLLQKIMARHRYATAVVGLLLLIFMSFSYLSLDLYLGMRSAQKEALIIENQWLKQSTQNFSTNQERAFIDFLQAWQRDDAQWAQFVIGFWAENSPEKKAALFLLDPRRPDQKMNMLDDISHDDKWFADYCIAEDYLKQGFRVQARQWYQRSLAQLNPAASAHQPGIAQFIINHLKARLYELEGTGHGIASPQVQEGSEP